MIKLFTDNDLDGAGCEILARILFKENVEVSSLSGGQAFNTLKDFIDSKEYLQYEKTYVTDLGLNPLPGRFELAEKIKELTDKGECKLLWIDHHQSSEWMTDYKFSKIDNTDTVCGTWMFYAYLKKAYDYPIQYTRPVLKQFVNLINDFDTWKWVSNNNFAAKNLNEIFKILSYKDFVEHYTKVFMKNFQVEIFPRQWTYLLSFNKKLTERLIQEKLKSVKIHNNKAFVLCDNRQIRGELASRVLQEYKVKYVAVVYEGGVKIVSNGFNVLAIARLYGGGGQKTSATFRTNEWYKWIIDYKLF
jgi:uncharacterized protein